MVMICSLVSNEGFGKITRKIEKNITSSALKKQHYSELNSIKIILLIKGISSMKTT